MLLKFLLSLLQVMAVQIVNQGQRFPINFDFAVLTNFHHHNYLVPLTISLNHKHKALIIIIMVL